MISTETLQALVGAVVVAIVGVVLARLAGRLLGRVLSPHLSLQSVMGARRLTTWSLYALTFIATLHQAGVDPGVLLGAAGLLTVAFGFASQTSASNIISGLFLIGERPFIVGDVIQVDTTTGEVVSIDLLSVKLRTFDNLFVRLPNETMVKSRMVNLTHFPLRRYDLQLAVNYSADLQRVSTVLLGVADANPRCLDEPAPQIIFQSFEDSAVRLQLSLWTATENYLDLRNSIALDVKAAFDAADIEPPFPQRSLVARGPLEVRVVDGD